MRKNLEGGFALLNAAKAAGLGFLHAEGNASRCSAQHCAASRKGEASASFGRKALQIAFSAVLVTSLMPAASLEQLRASAWAAEGEQAWSAESSQQAAEEESATQQTSSSSSSSQQAQASSSQQTNKEVPLTSVKESGTEAATQAFADQESGNGSNVAGGGVFK